MLMAPIILIMSFEIDFKTCNPDSYIRCSKKLHLEDFYGWL